MNLIKYYEIFKLCNKKYYEITKLYNKIYYDDDD